MFVVRIWFDGAGFLDIVLFAGPVSLVFVVNMPAIPERMQTAAVGYIIAEFCVSLRFESHSRSVCNL